LIHFPWLFQYCLQIVRFSLTFPDQANSLTFSSFPWPVGTLKNNRGKFKQQLVQVCTEATSYKMVLNKNQEKIKIKLYKKKYFLNGEIKTIKTCLNLTIWRNEELELWQCRYLQLHNSAVEGIQCYVRFVAENIHNFIFYYRQSWNYHQGKFFIVNNLVSHHCPEQVCLDELITFNANGALLHQL